MLPLSTIGPLLKEMRFGVSHWREPSMGIRRLIGQFAGGRRFNEVSNIQTALLVPSAVGNKDIFDLQLLSGLAVTYYTCFKPTLYNLEAVNTKKMAEPLKVTIYFLIVRACFHIQVNLLATVNVSGLTSFSDINRITVNDMCNIQTMHHTLVKKSYWMHPHFHKRYISRPRNMAQFHTVVFYFPYSGCINIFSSKNTNNAYIFS